MLLFSQGRRNICRQCNSLFIHSISPLRPPARSYAATPATSTKLPQDRAITATTIHLIGLDGKTQGTQRLSQVLGSYDPNLHTLVNVTPNNPVPTCRLYPRSVVQEMDVKTFQKKKEKKAVNPSNIVKECILNWNCTEHDLQHKLETGKVALRKGNKLQIGIGVKRKRGAKVPPESAKADLVKRVKELCSEAGKEWKQSQGNLHTGVMLYYLGKPQETQAEEGDEVDG